MHDDYVSTEHLLLALAEADGDGAAQRSWPRRHHRRRASCAP